MNTAAYSQYVIIDVRANGGGILQMGRFLASYFFAAGDEKFYLNGFYKDRTHDEQEWTYSFVPGRRNVNGKVFILISPNTGSAAEGFAYAMQKMHRATIIGEASAGAGIAGSYIPLKNNLAVFLPVKMVVAPNSQVGWEGTGVIPDSVVNSQLSLSKTRQIIFEDIIKNSKDSDLIASVKWQLEDSKAGDKMNIGWEKRYAGIFGKYNNNRYIIATKEGLIWRRADAGKPSEDYKIREVSKDTLTIKGYNASYGENSTRLYVIRDDKRKITSLQQVILLPNGVVYPVPTKLTK